MIGALLGYLTGIAIWLLLFWLVSPHSGSVLSPADVPVVAHARELASDPSAWTSVPTNSA